MSDKITPEIMDKIMRTPNWGIANEAAGLVLEAHQVFKPLPAPTPPSLVVPVDVQALYIPQNGNAGENFVRLPLDLSSGDPNLAKAANPFSPATRRSSGIHLHWALPDGLLRGEMSEDQNDPFKLRPLPDRWLVVRLTGRAGIRRLDLKGWVIESEAGRVFALDGYPGNAAISDTGPRIDPSDLTAIAGGSPSWTSGYDAALNRFAFHDDLSGLDTDTVLTGLASYVVMGWWNEIPSDPIARAFSSLSLSRTLDKLRWSASSAPVIWNYYKEPVLANFETVNKTFDKTQRTSSRRNSKSSSSAGRSLDLKTELRMGSSQLSLTKGYRDYNFDYLLLNTPRQPTNTVMHGVVYGVPVRGGIAKDQAPAAEKIQLAFAPTLETMIASFVSKGLNLTDKDEREYIENLVTAVANSSIRNIGSPDGIIALDEAEHVDGFESFQGPETYEDIIVEGNPDDLRGGRKQRSLRARQVSPAVLKADLMWIKGERGSTEYSQDAMNARVQDLLDEKFIPEANATDKTAQTAHKTSSMMSQRRSSQSRSSQKTSTNAASTATTPPPPLGRSRRVARAGPRYHRAVAPVIGLRNYGRSSRFNGDGLHNEDNTLTCRWANELATSFEGFDGHEYLAPLTNPELPIAVNRILAHSFAYDKYMLEWADQAIAATVPAEDIVSVQNRLRGELALRYSSDGVYDGTASVLRSETKSIGMMETQASQILFDHSLFGGVEPSPVSITAWSQPWSPIWLEWELEITPGDNLKGFTLDMIDFGGNSALLNTKPKISGRSPLTTGLARSYEATISAYLIAEAQRDENEAGEISDAHADTLADLAQYLSHPDMGSITVGGLEKFWQGLQAGPDGQVISAPRTMDQTLKEANLPRLLASGRLRLTKARVIDSFGRVRNLSVAKALHPAAYEVPATGGTKALRQPPRLTLPARLMWRLTDPADLQADAAEATLNQQDPDLTINPVAGFVLPDFIDEALEFFNAAGDPLGQVMHDSVTGGLAWEGGVGREGAASTLPTQGLSHASLPCGLMAQGMIDEDTALRADPSTAEGESPLSAMLRALDTTSWSVEGNLNLSGASIASLVGRPIAIVSARLRLDVPMDLSQTGAYGEEAAMIEAHLLAEAVHDKLKSIGFPVRLGEISKAHDGLYGYFINNDYSRFNLVEQSVSDASRAAKYGEGFRSLYGMVGNKLSGDFLPPPSPIECPYIATPDTLPLHNGQIVRLTLLMHPYARIHATSGILPRKSLELLRDWVAPGLSRIAPSARIGPVIIDPDKIRLPKIAAYRAQQSWVRRDSPITWREDPILSATQAALLPDGPVSVQEGYIRIAPHEPKPGGE